MTSETKNYLKKSNSSVTMAKPTEERNNLSIKGSYTPVIEKILRHRPHLKNKAGVVERALDFYLDDIVRIDKIKTTKRK